jgi:signal transduction histidine kinase
MRGKKNENIFTLLQPSVHDGALIFSVSRRERREKLNGRGSMTLIGRMTSMRLHRMTSLRLLRMYFVIFTAALVGLLAFIGWISSGEITRESDDVLSWQLRYLRLLPENQLADVIRTHLVYRNLHIHYYGLFAPDGARIAGDVLALPPHLPLWPRGETLEHTLPVADIARSPVVRVMAERSADGRILLVGLNMTHILALHRTVMTELIAGGALGLLLSIGAGIVVGIRQMRRLEAVSETAALVAQGDLSRRFRLGGRDEIAMLLHLVNHMLDEVERLMGEVKGACDGVAHNLRTPLARVRTLVARAAERPGALRERQVAEMLDHVRCETDVVLERFGAMLRVAQIAGLTRRGEFELVDLRALVLDIGALYAPLAESRGAALAMIADEQAIVRADRALLFEMLANLVTHAIGRVSHGANVRLELTLTDSGPSLVIASDRVEPEALSAERDIGPSLKGTASPDRYTGLSVAWAVARMHGFVLRLGSDEPSVMVDCWPQMSLRF